MTRKTTPTAASAVIAACQSRALIWRNDTSSSKRGRKVSHLRNVSTIHSVRKSRRLSEKRDNAKPDANKAIIRTGGSCTTSRSTNWTDSTIAICNVVSATDTSDAATSDTATSEHCGDNAPQREGVLQIQSRGTEATI